MLKLKLYDSGFQYFMHRNTLDNIWKCTIPFCSSTKVFVLVFKYKKEQSKLVEKNLKTFKKRLL